MQGEPWVTALETSEYGELSMDMRVAAIVALMHLALDGPSVRTCLDGRLEEAQRVRKAMWDEAKARRPLPASLLSLIFPSASSLALLCACRAARFGRFSWPAIRIGAMRGKAMQTHA